MRLNHDYVRDILLYIENNLDYKYDQTNQHKEISDGQLVCADCFKDYNKQELTYALELLIKSGFIDLASSPNIHNGNIKIARIIGLTWNGHELLDNIRNDTVWNAVKEKSKKFGRFSINTLATCAGQLTIALMTNPNAVQNFLDGVQDISKLFTKN